MVRFILNWKVPDLALKGWIRTPRQDHEKIDRVFPKVRQWDLVAIFQKNEDLKARPTCRIMRACKFFRKRLVLAIVARFGVHLAMLCNH